MTIGAHDTKNLFFVALPKCKHLLQFKELHSRLLRSGLFTYFPSSVDRLLAAATAAGGSTDTALFAYALSLFEHSSVHRNTFMYNTVIRGHVKRQSPPLSVSCYIDMVRQGIMANNYTYPPLIKACSLLLPLPIGHAVHAHVVRFGLCADGFVQSALVEFYSLVPDIGAVRRLFDGSAKKDVVVWTTTINGYAKIGNLETARELFEEMLERNVVSWSVLIAGYSQAGDFREVLSLFERMQHSGLEPNESILVSVLTACAQLGALAQGTWIHLYVRRCGLLSNVILATALVDMYAKCGCVASALQVFEDIPNKDVKAWNAVISGLAMNGDAKKSLQFFDTMVLTGVQPNDVTFLAVFGACRHAGLVEEGMGLFEQMRNLFRVKPQVEHHACIVDLLARAGHVEEAEKFIEAKMGGFGGGDANCWGALLSGCRIYRKFEVGNRVWEKVLALRPADCGTYVLLHNIYHEAGLEVEANKVRGLITEDGLKQKPGCSVIELNGKVEEFRAGNFSHPQAKQIRCVLDALIKEVRHEVLV